MDGGAQRILTRGRLQHKPVERGGVNGSRDGTSGVDRCYCTVQIIMECSGGTMATSWILYLIIELVLSTALVQLAVVGELLS